MLFKYRVYHSEKDKEPLVAFNHPFTEEEEVYQYRHLPTALDNHYTGLPIKVSSVPANPEKNGVQVTLVTELLEHEADDSLVQLLINLNKQIPGLCFVIEKM